VLLDKEFAGVIEAKDGWYSFTYDEGYLKKPSAKPVSLGITPG
jgi:HipA-like protein